MNSRSRRKRRPAALALVAALTAGMTFVGAPSAMAATGDEVALRQLIIANDQYDLGLSTWKAVLDRIGSPYDVVYGDSQTLDAGMLVRPDGVGKYNAVLLTNNSLLHQDSTGAFVSHFDATEWTTLWNYERTYRVRQVSLYTAFGTSPEDYCLRAGTEGGIGATPEFATLTTAGATVFPRLKASVRIPISESYVYRSVIAAGCNAQPFLRIGTDVVGVLSPTTDGRERAALTFTSNQYLPQTDLLGYGLVNWATRGIFVGEQRHWLNVDVDDWFNTSDHLQLDGTIDQDPGFSLTGPEVQGIYQQQTALRTKYPLAGDFTLNLAYNAGDADLNAPSQCSSTNTPDPFTSYTRCLSNRFRWINHTLTHPKMNFTTYDQSRTEIQRNLTLGRRIGLTVPTQVLKTGEYSGLGVYNPDPNALDTDPPTDFGLAASNREMLRAASDVGVKYLHGNMSFASHRPSCANCGIYHPLQPNLLIVPDWPTNIAYHTTNPDEETYFFNSFFGPGGRFAFFDHALTYAEVIDWESTMALQHVMSGSVYSHTLHISNVHVYAPGKTLTFDWLNAIMAKYTAYFKVPVRNPDWLTLAKYAADRNAHFAAIGNGRDAVWNRVTNTVTYTPAGSGALFMTGVTTLLGGVQTDRYGTENISRVSLTAGLPVLVRATPRA
ncbi:hypothetical protein [Actinophytocola sp.]|uniref:Agd3-related carbohydrate-binding protein n=1 Tax=Actinophytocola sp. TaxID=1872138 RepID=UPI002ED36840